MDNNNMIECLYGHHLCEKEEFTQAGLNGPYKYVANNALNKLYY